MLIDHSRVHVFSKVVRFSQLARTPLWLRPELWVVLFEKNGVDRS